MFNIERHYNPRVSVKNYKFYLNSSLKQAKVASKYMNNEKDIFYGDGKLQNLDVYYKKNKILQPLHIFVHGGYWRALDKSYSSHMATPFYNNNIVFFNINYDLCPNVKLTDIKNQVIKAILWIYKNAKRYNADNKNITISGHSAGAHLVSLMLGVDWNCYNIPLNVFKGISLISGIFNTEIVLDLKVNNEIGLTKKEAVKNNSFYISPFLKPQVLLSYGSYEPKLWKAQTIEFNKFLKKNKISTYLIECKNQNHFTIIDYVSRGRSILSKKMVNLSR